MNTPFQSLFPPVITPTMLGLIQQTIQPQYPAMAVKNPPYDQMKNYPPTSTPKLQPPSSQSMYQEQNFQGQPIQPNNMFGNDRPSIQILQNQQ